MRLQKKVWEDMQHTTGSKFLQASHEKVNHESMRVNQKVVETLRSQRCQDHETPVEKSTGNNLNHPEKEAVWATPMRAIEVGLPRFFRVHILPPHAPYARQGLNFTPAWLQSWFGLIFYIPLLILFGKGIFSLCYCTLEMLSYSVSKETWCTVSCTQNSYIMRGRIMIM